MRMKIILAAVSLSLAFAALHPVLAGSNADPTDKQIVIKQPIGISPIPSDLHVYLKSFF